MTPPAPSGDDVSYLAVESSDTISRDRIRSALAVAGVAVTGSVAWHGDGGTPGRWQLIEVDGFVAEEDERLQRFRRAARRRCRADRGAGQLPETACPRAGRLTGGGS